MTLRRFARRFSLAIASALLLLLSPVTAGAVAIQTLDMGRGAQVWYVEDHTLPMIAMTVAIPAGSAYDPEGKAGLAAFAAAMLDEGAGPYNSAGFQGALNGRAIRLSASPDRDWLLISLVTLKENAPAAFRLLGIALAKPHFDPEAITRVRAQIIAGIQEGDEDPATIAAKGFFGKFFAGHPYAHPASGDPASVATITRADLVNFARDHWVRGGIHIAVSGDIDAASLKTLIASSFSALPNRSPPPVPPVRRMGAPGVSIIPIPVPQPNIVFGLPAIPRSDPGFIPSYVANYILGGGGFSSRLTSEVREKRGLTYDISTSVLTMHRAALLAGQVATKAGSVNQTIAVIRDTMNNFAQNGPTQKEMDDAKTYLTGSFPLAFTSNAGIAGQLNAFQKEGLPLDYVQKRNDLINAVTIDDVRRVSKRIFDAGRLTIVIAGSPDTQTKQPAKPLPSDKPRLPPHPVPNAKRPLPPPPPKLPKNTPLAPSKGAVPK
jgi:zinc protease